MLKRNNRKGFTLAELLIAVAIVAVLVSIAVPLFVSGLQKAKDARDSANISAVKTAAIYYVSDTNKDGTDSNFDIFANKKDDTNKVKAGEYYKYFEAVAHVSESGEITMISIKGKNTKHEAWDSTAEWNDAGYWKVTVHFARYDVIPAA